MTEMGEEKSGGKEALKRPQRASAPESVSWISFLSVETREIAACDGGALVMFREGGFLGATGGKSGARVPGIANVPFVAGAAFDTDNSLCPPGVDAAPRFAMRCRAQPATISRTKTNVEGDFTPASVGT